MIKHLTILLTLLVVQSLPVSAQNFQTKTVERLVAECEGSSTDNLNKRGCEGSVQSSRDIVVINCSGLSKFIDQVMSLGGDIEQQITVIQRVSKLSADLRDVTLDESINTFIEWAGKHPDRKDWPAGLAIGLSLTGKYPCEVE
jgi:hypothetical protein